MRLTDSWVNGLMVIAPKKSTFGNMATVDGVILSYKWMTSAFRCWSFTSLWVCACRWYKWYTCIFTQWLYLSPFFLSLSVCVRVLKHLRKTKTQSPVEILSCERHPKLIQMLYPLLVFLLSDSLSSFRALKQCRRTDQRLPVESNPPQWTYIIQ